MKSDALDQIRMTPEKRITIEDGDVLHGIKSSSPGFFGFGEAYFSFVLPNRVKAWKKHNRITMNLIVPVGTVRFVFLSLIKGQRFRQETIGSANYCRLTVPPGIWFGFQGLDDQPSLIMSLINQQHDPKEVERRSIEEVAFDWVN
jgi:dTDP-4-dehydrorhamnose 3,5-epimerase